MTDPGISTAPAWSFGIGFASDLGRERDRNEDACAVFVPYRGEEALAPVSGVFAVADGMGGHDAGDVASRHVVEAITAAFAPGAHADPLSLPVSEAIESLIRRVHNELREMAASHAAERGMGSTLALAVVEGDTLYLTSVGDSRGYRLRAQRLERLTEDQSWVADQVRAGLLSAEEAEQHPKRNVLTHCLGIGSPPPVRIRQETIEAGDRFLLCSDGLHGPVPDEVIARVLAEEVPQRAVERLVALANERGGPDNITVVVFEAQPRRDELAITIPPPQPPPQHAVPRRRNWLSIGLLAVGVLLLAGAVGAWFWFRPESALSSRATRSDTTAQATTPPADSTPAAPGAGSATADTTRPQANGPDHPQPRGNQR